MAQQCAIVTGSMKHPESTSLPPCQSDLHPQTWQRELLLPPSRSSVRAQARGGHAPSSPALSAASISSSRGGKPLAAGWEVRHSKSKNRSFYVNKTTGATQWKHPGVVSDDDVFCFSCRNKIGACSIYLEEGTYHKRLFRGPSTNDMKK
jgi:hypothetical protein